MTEPLVIALDYDNTYDADPVAWDHFIKIFKGRGHHVVVLTFRDDRYDKTPLLLDLEKSIPVYYTRGVAKRWWSDQFGPGKIDVWIDDRPEAIISNSLLDREKLAIWRAEDQKTHYPND